MAAQVFWWDLAKLLGLFVVAKLGFFFFFEFYKTRILNLAFVIILTAQLIYY